MEGIIFSSNLSGQPLEGWKPRDKSLSIFLKGFLASVEMNCGK